MSRYVCVLQALLLFLSAVLADPNRLVSNGTCYYAAGKEADQVYIPCGNVAFGTYSCCMQGDTCLSSNACFNAECTYLQTSILSLLIRSIVGDTYLAGCTDPTFEDPACGRKGMFGEQQWVGLVRCFVSNDTSSNEEEWAPCTESSQPTVTKPNQGCECTASAHTAAFTDNPSLTNFAVLPANAGLTISWQPGHTPPSDLTPTSASAPSTSAPSDVAPNSASRTSSTIPAATTTSDLSQSSSPNPHSLTTGAEVGLGVGIGLGVLAICGILFLLYRRHLRKKQQQQQSTPYSESVFASHYNDDRPLWALPKQVEKRDAPDMRSPAWSGHKSELPAEDRSTSQLIPETPYEGSSAYIYRPDRTPNSQAIRDENIRRGAGSETFSPLSLTGTLKSQNSLAVPPKAQLGGASWNASPGRGGVSRTRQELHEQIHELPGSSA